MIIINHDTIITCYNTDSTRLFSIRGNPTTVSDIIKVQWKWHVFIEAFICLKLILKLLANTPQNVALVWLRLIEM